MSKRKILLGIFILGSVSVLTGCTTKYSSPPSKSEVLKEVAISCPSEQYELIDVVENKEFPREITYKFRTDRGLEFEAIATIGEKGSMGGSFKDYEKKISVNYWDSIYEQYNEEIQALFPDSQGELYYQVYLVMEGPQDIENIADRISQAQLIFSPELEYNNQQFLEENSKVTFTVSYTGGQHHKTCDYKLTGICNRDDIVAQLQSMVDDNYGTDNN